MSKSNISKQKINIIKAFLDEQGIAYVEDSERLISFDMYDNTYKIWYNDLSPQLISIGLLYTRDALDRHALLCALNEGNSQFAMTKCSLLSDDTIKISIDLIVGSTSVLNDIFYVYLDMILRTAVETAKYMKMIVDETCSSIDDSAKGQNRLS